MKFEIIILTTLVIGTLSSDVFFKPLLDFTLNVFKEICKKDKGNTLLAVASLSQELSILYEAASTSSRQEMFQVLQFPETNREIYKSVFENMKNQFVSSKLRSGVRLFVDRKVHLENNFNETMVNYFNAKVELLNFKYPEAVATRVNSWVDQITHRIIHTIVDKDDIKSNAPSLILATAMYFKGKWKLPFLQEATSNEPFSVSPEETIEVPTMYVVGDFQIRESSQLKTTFVKIPYQDPLLYMIVALPDKDIPLDVVLEAMKVWPSNESMNDFETRPMEILLPRFVVESSIELVPILQETGLKLLFSSGSELTNMSPDGDLTIGSVRQKARLEVNEEGSTAGVVTGLILLTLLVTSHGLPRRSRSLTDFVGEGTNELAIAVLQGYVDSETNLAFSPLGYSALLAILAEGAKGETRNQLVNALHLPQEDQVTRNTYKNVLSRLQTKNELNAPEFRNWFYVYKNFSVEQSYKDILLHNYLTEVKNVERVSYEDQIRDVTKPNKELEALMEMDKDSFKSPNKKVAMSEMTKEKQEIMAIKAEVQKIEEQTKPDASMELIIKNETSDHIKNESMKMDEGKSEEGVVKDGVMKEGTMQEGMMKGEGMKAGTIQDDTIKEKLAPEKNELLTVDRDLQAGAIMEQSMMHDALKEGEMIQEAMRMEAQMGSMHEIIKEQIPAMSQMVKGESEMSNTENEKIGAEMSNMEQEKIEPEISNIEKEEIKTEKCNTEKEKIKPEMINMEKEKVEPEMSNMEKEKVEPEMSNMEKEKVKPEMSNMEKEKIKSEMNGLKKETIETEMSNMEMENSETDTIEMQEPLAGSLMMQVADKEMDKPLDSEMDKKKLGMEKIDKEMLKRIKRFAEFLRGDRGLLQDPDVTSGLSGNNIVKKTSEKPDSIMVVFNALYYRGSWATPFSGQRADLPNHFYKSDTEKITVPTMHVQDTFNIGLIPDLDSVAIELPYKGGRYSLVVLLPNQRTGLRPLIADHLTSDTLKNLDKYMSPKEVRVCLPSFEIGTTTKPIEPLKKFGVVDVFNPDAANLSGISQESGLYVDDLVQYVAIRVDQRESSANYLTSSSSIPVESREGDYERFVADHPFLYFVKDHVDDIIVVAGKVIDPTIREE